MFTPHHLSHVTCDMSHVLCNVSHVTCPVSHVRCYYFFLLQCIVASCWRVCYQLGLPSLDGDGDGDGDFLVFLDFLITPSRTNWNSLCLSMHIRLNFTWHHLFLPPIDNSSNHILSPDVWKNLKSVCNNR